MRLFRERLRRVPVWLEALAWLTGAWLVLDVLPGKLYRRLLPEGVDAGGGGVSTRATVEPYATDAEMGRSRPVMLRVAWAVSRASRSVPFRSVCFHRGLAAQRMLRSRGIASTLHYGVARTQERALEAHVWVTCGGADVVGGAARGAFQEISRFTALVGEPVRAGEART